MRAQSAPYALAQSCTGTITAEDALEAEQARYAAQATNDLAAMEKTFGNDLVYNHSSAASAGAAAATGRPRT